MNSSIAVGRSPGSSRSRRQLVGVLQQGERAVAADVHRRLVAGVEQQDAGGDQLVLGEPVAVGVAHAHQVADQVLARAPCAARRPARAGRRRTRRPRARRTSSISVVRPYSYIFTIALDHGRSSGRSASGTPEQLGDDGDRQLLGHARTAGRPAPSRRSARPARRPAAGQVLDPRAQPLDVPAGERRADQPAQPGVLGRLHLQDGVAVDEVEAPEPLGRRPVPPDPAQPPVAQHRVGLGVA